MVLSCSIKNDYVVVVPHSWAQGLHSSLFIQRANLRGRVSRRGRVRYGKHTRGHQDCIKIATLTRAEVEILVESLLYRQ
jgi:hypothetical protein